MALEAESRTWSDGKRAEYALYRGLTRAALVRFADSFAIPASSVLAYFSTLRALATASLGLGETHQVSRLGQPSGHTQV